MGTEDFLSIEVIGGLQFSCNSKSIYDLIRSRFSLLLISDAGSSVLVAASTAATSATSAAALCEAALNHAGPFGHNRSVSHTPWEAVTFVALSAIVLVAYIAVLGYLTTRALRQVIPA